MKSKLLTICVLGLLAVPGLMTPSAAIADAPGMMRYQMDEDEMMMRYGRERGMMYGPMMMGGPMMMSGMMGGSMMDMGMMMGGFSELNLSKEQRSKIRAIMQENRKTHLELMDKMFVASDNLSELYDTDTPDPEKIGKAYDEVFAIKKQMIQESLRIHNKAFEVLTKEQKEKYRKQSAPYRSGMMR
jgi:Spy/CpxP family protein refolding chaperone